MINRKVPLFWYSLYRFNKNPSVFSAHFLRRKFGKEKENYGDLLSKYIVEKVSKKRTDWCNPKNTSTKHLFAIGSILNLTTEKSIVWGSGIINTNDVVKASDFRAVRGPYTRENILHAGKSCPEVYGDPAILLPQCFNPVCRKSFKLGIIPHIYDLTIVRKLSRNLHHVKVINLYTWDVEKTTREILSCERIISSSLHGVIVPHAYGIPSVWCRFSNNLIGDNIKFKDYFSSVNITEYKGEMLDKIDDAEINSLFDRFPQPKMEKINYLAKGLLSNFPYSDF